MKRLDELDYVPTEWSKRLAEEYWITTAGDLLSNCRIPGGLERLAQTLGTTAEAVAEVAAKLSEELGEDYASAPIEAPPMGLVPPDEDPEGGTQ